MPRKDPDRRRPPAPEIRESTGYESADVVAEVLEDVKQQETGPPPELEAMHSAVEAVAQCRVGIEATLAN